ncbi:hypothetical protein ASPNIDRAFT_37765 [Aspergillus niger ATCC 1015]|uniref:Uncharacterized protein n=1 Tax=Aspergillus niger (strain ATCC 1015 / CBS 113.46 / FGSC A1144 / LSHB Ac4 / NCTC 3858a / NRRL 328 / USDA 3528.7) TaxID=380704 RepID=G3YGF1_ASPNA|nr:hypothetical protein ASPNIDRAFT_37765 [Aspergillus niger ATCC 1015]
MGAMIRHGLSSAQVRHRGGRIRLYPPVGYKLRGGRPGNGYARRCLASASRVTRMNDDIKYFCDTWNVTLLQPIRVTNAKNPLRLTLCVGVCRPPNRSAPDSARSQLRGSFHAVFSASQSPACSSRHPSREIWLGPSSRQSGLPGCETTDLLFRPIQVFKSEANSWSCRQPGPLVTHAPSLTIVEVTVPWGKGVSSGIPTGMPVSEHSLGGLGYPPKWDKRVPPGSYAFCVDAALIDLIRPVPCTGEMEDGGVCRSVARMVGLS